MKNLSLDQFYRKINKKILLVGGYLENNLITHIIKSCRLKPLSVFSNEIKPDTILERIWVDEFDNNIEINKKKPKINLNAKPIQHTTTDMFRNETIQFVLDHSTMACIGLFPGSTNFILLLKGTDNYFRCYSCQNNELSICSPLTVGLKVLKQCFPTKLKYFTKLVVKSEIKHLKEVEWIITNLPVQKLLLPNIATYTKLRNILYNE